MLARGFSRQHRITHFATIGSASHLRIHERRICLPLSLPAYPRTTIAWDGLPSCVTPSLTYYQIRPGVQPHPRSEEQEGLRTLSITGFDMGASTRVREYQPVVHRLRLSASP